MTAVGSCRVDDSISDDKPEVFVPPTLAVGSVLLSVESVVARLYTPGGERSQAAVLCANDRGVKVSSFWRASRSIMQQCWSSRSGLPAASSRGFDVAGNSIRAASREGNYHVWSAISCTASF